MSKLIKDPKVGEIYRVGTTAIMRLAKKEGRSLYFEHIAGENPYYEENGYYPFPCRVKTFELTPEERKDLNLQPKRKTKYKGLKL